MLYVYFNMLKSEVPSQAEWLKAEPWTLGMSSGFCGFPAHLGTAAALIEHDLMPEQVRGSSAGIYVATLLAFGVEPERALEEISKITRGQVLRDLGLGFGLMRGELLGEVSRKLIGDVQIQDADIPVNVSVTDVYSRRAEVLRTGRATPALMASCALPVLVQPVYIDGRPKLDGGIKDRPGLAESPLDERLLHCNLPQRGIRSKFDRGHAAAFEGRNNFTSLEIPDIPRVTPFTLDKSTEVFHYTKAQTELALSMPVQETVA